MSEIERWVKELESFKDKSEKYFMTQAEFEAGLDSVTGLADSPVDAVQYHIVGSAPFNAIDIGRPGTGDAMYVDTVTMADPRGSTCKTSIWTKRNAGVAIHASAALAKDSLGKLIKGYWKPDLLDNKAKLPSLLIPRATQVLEDTILDFAKTRERTFLFFCDLDKFKLVNDTYGENVGDRVILEFASIIERTVIPNAVALHRSGDEFIVFCPTDTVESALFVAHKIMREVRQYDFQIGNLTTDVSIGIKIVDRETPWKSYKDLEDMAEKALKPSGQGKRRGMARFADEVDQVGLPLTNDLSKSLAVCVVKSGMGADNPFVSPWLNMISEHVEISIQESFPNISGIKEEVDTIVDWIKPSVAVDTLHAGTLGSEASLKPYFSPIDMALATAHGVFRASLMSGNQSFKDKSLKIYFDSSQGACQLCLCPDGEVIMQFGTEPSSWPDTIDLGGFFRSYDDKPRKAMDSRAALLVKIGHSKLELPVAIFGEIIVVDDRPTQGGGLPDFWEATIARLVARVESNANIMAVYILGEHKYAAQTIGLLRDVGNWAEKAESIASKTGMSIHSISTAASRLSGKIVFPEDIRHLCNNLMSVLLGRRLLYDVMLPVFSTEKYRTLHRELLMEGIALLREDGCRVKTIAEAYPVVLEIARKASHKARIKDQAGMELKELVDFKVLLTNPNQDLVPLFYQEEKDSLEGYFTREFQTDTGLFLSKFKEGGQLDAVLTHLSTHIRDLNHQFATRRGILVVPHDVEEGHDIRPLGLISIRIFPRFMDNRVLLYYSYTWRTVEALVGFPYSVYGSVRFSQYLTEEVKRRLPREQSRRIEMGEVSYIAHSLHIFMDDYGENIARRIVDDASL